LDDTTATALTQQSLLLLLQLINNNAIPLPLVTADQPTDRADSVPGHTVRYRRFSHALT